MIQSGLALKLGEKLNKRILFIAIVSMCIFFVFVQCVWCENDGRKFSKLEIFDFKVSPQLDRIMVLSKNTTKGYLFLLDVKDKKLKKLTSGTFADASWSPNGEKISYIKIDKRRKLWHVCTFSLTEGKETILDSEGINYSPKWSRSGNFIAFSSMRLDSPNPFERLYLVNSKKRSQPRLAAKCGNICHFWSWCWFGREDNLFLCIRNTETKNGDLYVVNVKTETKKKLSSNYWTSANTIGSPVEDRVFWEDYFPPKNAYVYDTNSKKIIEIFKKGTDNNISSPKWSPDGKKIAFFLIDDKHNGVICTIKSDGSNLKAIAQHLDFSVYRLDWLSNEKLIFSSDGKSLQVLDIETLDVNLLCDIVLSGNVI